MTDQNAVPEGLSFLQLIWKQEDDCEAATDELIPNLGEKAPACLDRIGTVVSFVDRMASCWWRCRGGDHLIERLCGRVSSTTRAALRLLRLGFYDEALLACRAIGEVANILQLFHADMEAFEQWKKSSKNERVGKFRPVKVRLRLEGLKINPAIDRERYSLLCERVAHVDPETKPQSYNALHIPMTGGRLQEDGLVVCINEIALPLSFATFFGILLLDFEDDIKKLIISAVMDLAEHIGGAQIATIDEYHRRVLENLKRVTSEYTTAGEFGRR